MRTDWRKGTMRDSPRPTMARRRPGSNDSLRGPMRLIRRVMLWGIGLSLLLAAFLAFSGG